jgi:hypothetical protein
MMPQQPYGAPPMQPQQEQFGAPPQQVYAEQPQMMQPEMMQQPGVFPVPLPPCWLPAAG